jgi:4-alpha-glucanotransferase
MLPNVFPGSGEEPEYNTVDAALWYIEAWRAYAEHSKDMQAVDAVFDTLASIIDHYQAGTRYGIRMDPRDSLIYAGEPDLQLTWMDAKVGSWVITPRTGKPVEVNALWYNALVAMAELAIALGREAAAYATLAEEARLGFGRFRRGPGEGLYDVLDGPRGDEPTVRPNQILAVSLHHSPLDAAGQRAVLEECGRALLCSYGLRSLAPDDPDYHGAYGGTPTERDGAYHQGPVWAWLLGHYALAELRVTGDPKVALTRLTPVADHLRDAGLGSISEIFEGDPPHQPRGAPCQAWSVACVLEAWWHIERARREQEDTPGA